MRPSSRTIQQAKMSGESDDLYTCHMKIGKLANENQSLLFKLKEAEFNMKLLAITNFFFVCLTVLLI